MSNDKEVVRSARARSRRSAAKSSETSVAVPSPTPEPKPSHKRSIAAARERFNAGPNRVEVKLTMQEGGVPIVDSPHSDKGGFTAELAGAFGTTSFVFAESCLLALINAASPRGRKATEAQVNGALAFVSAIEPGNEMEAALALQMFAAHDLAMDMLQRTRHANEVPVLHEYSNIATKLTRTFTAQVEALAKLRRGGEQIVKHVHVHEGGQAVVAGTINQGGEGEGKSSGQPHEQAADALIAALPDPDETRDGVPLPSHVERPVSKAWRGKHGCANRQS